MTYLRRILPLILVIIALAAVENTVFAQANVTTGQSDYPPGSTVQIYGAGFQPGETVQLQVLNVTDPSDTGPEHDPWTVTSDTNGNFTATWYVTADEVGMTLQLTATGLISGLMAQATFTDGSVESINVGAQNGTLTYGTTTSATFTISFTTDGNASYSGLHVSGLPAGATSHFSATVGSGNPPANQTLTITTAANTPAGSFTITVATTSPTLSTNATLTVGKVTPTISGVTASQNITYGTATVSLSGTVSATGSVYPTNGETVSVTINSIATNAVISGGAGGFSVNFSTATIPYSASAYTITYAYAGDANLNAAVNNTGTALTVNQAALGITANNQSKTYGTTLTLGAGQTAFTSSGLKNSETIGSVTLSASGGTNSTAAAGSYTLTPSAATGGTFTAGNYTVTYTNGTLTVNKAATSVTVLSSKNPAGFKDSVSFAATNLSADATGSILFLTNSAPFSTNSLSGGGAGSTATILLPRGTNTITVQYIGDSNYLGSTNILTGGQVVTNHPPVAGNATYTRTVNSLKIFTSNLLTNYVTDPDGNTLTVSSTGISTNGITLQNGPGFFGYINANSVNDRFSYTVTDGFGGSATAFIYINFNPFVAAQNATVVTSNNVARLAFCGIPGYRYGIERSTNLVGWTLILITNAPGNGAFLYTDNFSDLGSNAPASAFYRLLWNP